RGAERLFAATATAGVAARPDAGAQPACEFLGPALASARAESGPIAALADALAGISPRLAWSQRPNGADDDADFKDRHANAVVFGVNGLEQRNDVRIGISLLAPETRYPDHRHPPEEIYTVLSPGDWKQGVDGPWRSPGIGGFVHNTPNIVHAMRSKDVPLLAVWCLWIGDTA
ncbi:MAG: dimethylsulfoniopropionate lyase, partial [Alphaproteobacteria bacterium]|nr:dimethylsulfoniopropionate lyase [Alphaproteobacteria bacterium]